MNSKTIFHAPFAQSTIRDQLIREFDSMFEAPTLKETENRWKEIRKLLDGANLTPEDRDEVTVRFRERARQKAIQYCEEKHREHPEAFPKLTGVFLAVLNELHTTVQSSLPKEGEFELTLHLSNLLKSLELCTEEMQVYHTVSVLSETIEKGSDAVKEACYRKLLRIVEDCTLTQLFTAAPKLQLTRRDNLLLSFLSAIDGSPHDEYSLDFIELFGGVFLSVDYELILKSETSSFLKRAIKTFLNALLNLPSDYAAYCSRRISDIPCRVIEMANVELDEENAFRYECMKAIESGEFFAGTYYSNGNNDIEDLMDAMDSASALGSLLTAEELKETWNSFCKRARKVPFWLESLADRAFCIMMIQVFEAISIAYNNELPEKLGMLMRFCLALSVDSSHLYDDIIQTWILGEPIKMDGGKDNG